MNESEIIDKLSCLVCYPAKILIVNLPVYFTINKAKSPHEKKVDLLLYPQALIMRSSNGFRDYFYGIIRWQDLKSITVESQGNLNLFVYLTGLMFFLSYLTIILVTKIFFAYQAFPADSLFPLIAALFSSVLVGVLLMLQLPKYCLQLKTNSEFYVLTIKDSGDFSKIKLFAEKIVEQIERSLEPNSGTNN